MPAEASHRGTPTRALARRRTLSILALASAAGYLTWRLGTLGRGWTLALSVPLLIVEIWGALQLAALVHQAWHPPAPTPPLGSPEDRVHVVVTAGGADLDQIERTLVGCSTITGDVRVRVLDDRQRPEVAALARSFGADHDEGLGRPIAALGRAIAATNAPYVLWLDAGQIPMPDVLVAALPRFADPGLAVIQLGVGLLNPDSLAHLRGRDESALTREVLGPGLGARGLGPWTGAAAIIRRAAIEDIGGVPAGGLAATSRCLVRLHRAGWRSSFDARPLVRASAPDTLGDYLAARRQRAADGLSLLVSPEGPLRGRGLTARAHLGHLTPVVGYGAGVRQLLLAAVVALTLLTGALPFDAPLAVIVPAWVAVTGLGAVARRELAEGTMELGDWVRHAWRTLGADLAAVAQVVGWRGQRREVADRRGVRVLAQLPVLTAAVLVLDAALLARTATLAKADLLPAFSTGGRLVALTAGIALLVPMIDVLQVIVRRKQRRGGHRVPVALPFQWRASLGETIDLAVGGVGVALPHAPPVGARGLFRLELPRIDGTVRVVEGEAEVRAGSRLEDGRVRVGMAFTNLDAGARRALLEFCLVEGGRQRDRRRTARLVTRLPVDLGGAAAETVDLTPRGVGIVLDTAPLVGSEVRLGLELPRPDAPPVPIQADAIVRSVTRRPEGGHRVGLELSSLGAGARAALIRYCAIDHARIHGTADAAGDSDPRELPVPHRRRRRRSLQGVSVAAILGGAITAILGPAAGAALAAPQTTPISLCVVDAAGAPVPDVPLRYHDQGWQHLGTTDAAGSVEARIVARARHVEAQFGSARFVLEVDASSSPTATFALARLVADPGVQVTAVETGGAWQPFEDGMDVAPGRVRARLSDGSVAKLAVPPGRHLSVPSGDVSGTRPRAGCGPDPAPAPTNEPTATPPTPTAEPTPEPTATPATPTAEPTPEPTAPAPTAEPTPEPTATAPAPTAEPTPEPTATPPAEGASTVGPAT